MFVSEAPFAVALKLIALVLVTLRRAALVNEADAAPLITQPLIFVVPVMLPEQGSIGTANADGILIMFEAA